MWIMTACLNISATFSHGAIVTVPLAHSSNAQDSLTWRVGTGTIYTAATFYQGWFRQNNSN